MTRLRRRALLAIAIASALGGAVAAAKDGDGPQLEFVGPPGCPDAAYFARRIASRRTRPREVGASEPGLVVRATVTRTTRGATGRLIFLEPGRSTSERTVAAADCREVTDALALIAAIALDRRLRSAPGDATGNPGDATGNEAQGDRERTPASPPETAPAGTPGTPPALSPAAPPGPAGGESASAPAASGTPAPSATPRANEPPASGSTPPATASPPVSPGVFDRDRPPVARRDSPYRSPWSIEAGAAALATVGMAPGPTAGIAGWIGVRRRLPPPLDPAMARIGVFDTSDRSFARSEGTASFGVLSATAALCPIGLRLGRGTSIGPCAVGELGQLRASGFHTTHGRGDTRLWAAAGAGATLSQHIIGGFALELSAAVLAAATRARFLVGAEDVFVVPQFVGRATLGLRVLWP